MQSWLDIQNKLSDRQAIVYATLKTNGSMSNMELSEVLCWSINRVTPRVLELRKEGFIYLKEQRHCKVTGRLVNVWCAR